MKSRIVSDRVFSLLLLGTILISLFTFSDAFAAQTVNDRKIINSASISGDLLDGDLFGYQIEAIGDLDSDGVIDLATIKFSDDSGSIVNLGSILILFMNSDGTVDSTNEITMEGQLTTGIGNKCLDNESTNVDSGSIEQLAFIGDLDGDDLPTIALGANSNNHGGITDSGIVYMLELTTAGKVDNCFPIVPNNSTRTTGFDPAAGAYRESDAANFGWPLIATDLNGDGQNELLVGANSESNLQTDLWPLFLNSTGGVDSHPLSPISGLSIGIDSNEFIADGASISGTKIVVSNENDGDGGGSVFIVNLSAAGAFVSSTEIPGSDIAGVANDERFGSGVTPIGDLDNDGVNDILVGNEAGDDTNALSGEVHILYLNSDDTLKESQKISNESENTRTGVNPFSASDIFGHGMSVWFSSTTEVVIAISATQNDDGGDNRGAIHLLYIERAVDAIISSGGSGDTTPSTLGVNSHGQKLVDDGFSFNGKSVDVKNYHTPFPLTSVLAGFPNTVEMKIYENGGLSKINRVQFGLGVEETGTPLSESEVIVLINLHHNGTSVESIGYEGNTALLFLNKTNVELSIVPCKANSFAECLLVSLTYTYRAGPDYTTIVVNTMDDRRNSWNYYFNDGIKVIGSMNPPATTEIFVKNGKQDTGEHLTLTQIHKINDIWKDIYDVEYQNNNGSFDRITPYTPWTCNDPPLEQLNVPTRLNCNFRALTTIWG